MVRLWMSPSGEQASVLGSQLRVQLRRVQLTLALGTVDVGHEAPPPSHFPRIECFGSLSEAVLRRL